MTETLDQAGLPAVPQAQPPARPLRRVRIQYARGQALRYVGHLDIQMVWERTLRRAGVPLAYSRGFTQHARLHLASALPLGFLSRCELADFWMESPTGEDMAPEGQAAPPVTGGETNRLPEPGDQASAAQETACLAALAAQIQAAAPPGLEITRIEFVPLSQPALQAQVQAAVFSAYPLERIADADLRRQVDELLRLPSLVRERRGKDYDLRPLIERLEVQTGPQGEPGLSMRLSAREGATGRPEEVLAALGYDPAAFRVERTALVLG